MDSHAVAGVHPFLAGDLFLSMVFPHIGSFRHLNLFSCTNKTFNSQLDKPGGLARLQWIDLAAKMTDCPEKEFFPEKISKSLSELKDRADFFDHVRALICPWTSRPVYLPARALINTLPLQRYMFLSKDNSRLIFHAAYKSSFQASCPSSLISDWGTHVRLSEKHEVIEEQVSLEKNDRSYEREIVQRLTRDFNIYDFTNSRIEDASFSAFTIHGGVFAVLATFDKNERVSAEGQRGIYFFAYNDCRMLSHKVMRVSDMRHQSFVQSRPGQLWILRDDRLVHYRATDLMDSNGLPGDGPAVVLSTKTERMDDALFMAAQGDADGAMQFLARDLEGVPINTRAWFNNKTLLHYAAVNGHAEAVAMLLDAGANHLSPDLNQITPLRLACRKLHHECVFLMVHGMDVPTHEWENCWYQLCKFEQLRRYISLDPGSVDHFCNVAVPEIVQILFENKKEVLDVNTLRDYCMRGLRSQMILASPKATKYLLELGGENVVTRFKHGGGFRFVFGCFGASVLESEALKTLRMAVDSFGLDINFRFGVTQETHLVWAVRNGSFDAVKLLVEELGADIHALTNAGDGIHKLAIMRCVMGSRDQDGVRILEYVDRILKA